MSSADILCLGEPLAEFTHLGGDQWREGIGGDVSNVAIAASRQGARAGIVTRIGTDAFGDALMAAWQAEGVFTDGVSREPTAPTGVYFIRHGPEGHRFDYLRAGSAASRVTPETLPRAAIRTARVLHLSGISQAISDASAATCDAAMTEARSAGVMISHDPNLRLKLWPLDRARAVIHAAMARADVALPGLEDAQMLTGLTTPDEIVRFYRNLGPRVVALTLGAEGALIATPGQTALIRAPKVRAVDATGAGDCFDGAFLARLIATGDPFQAGQYAVTAAALSVEGLGAVPSIPHARTVRAALDAFGASEVRAR